MDTPTILVAGAALLAALLVRYHLVKFSFWSSRGVAGPQPWPIFGTNIYYLFRDKLDVDQSWLRQYGKVYGIYEGYSPTLRIVDNEVIKQIYIKQFHSFTDRNANVIHGDNARRWLLWSKGDHWANQRALVTPMFTSNKMRNMFAKMSECIENFLREAERRLADVTPKRANADKSKASVFFVKRDLMSMTLDVIAQSFFSIKIDAYNDGANEYLRRAYDFIRVDIWWFILWSLVPGPLAKYYKIDLVPFSRYQYFDALSQRMIDERRHQKSAAAAPGKIDLIQALLDAKIPDQYERVYSAEDEKEAHYNDQISLEELENIQKDQTKAAKLFRHFSDIEIRGLMTFFFLAGFEATASTIYSCVYELAHQPAAQREVHEQLASTRKSAVVDGTGELGYSDLLEMIKLDAFVSEAMRLHSTLIENNRLVTAKEGVNLQIGPEKSIWLPRNTAISTNFFVVHRHGDYFERPDEFDMTRFYPENRDKIKSCTYMPFGLGPRNCVGMRFALLEMKLFLAKLLLKYEVRPGPETQAYPPKYTHHPIFLRFKFSDFTLIPRD